MTNEGTRNPLFCGTPIPTPLFKKLGLRLRVKVEHRLLNWCDCDIVLSEGCRETHSQDFKKKLIIWDYYFKNR